MGPPPLLDIPVMRETRLVPVDRFKVLADKVEVFETADVDRELVGPVEIGISVAVELMVRDCNGDGGGKNE